MIDADDVISTINVNYKGKTAEINSYNPSGFWKISCKGLPAKLGESLYTNVDLAAQKFKAWVDEEEFKEATRKPTIAEAHYNRLMDTAPVETPAEVVPPKKKKPGRPKKEPKVELTQVERPVEQD